jgi:hypothetical protein
MCQSVRKIAMVFTIVVTSSLLLSCEPGRTPFSLNIFKFNEQGPQQPAAITVSDPQIYARETLINDRIRERKLLRALLTESEKLDFRKEVSQPALIRDLETLEAFKAAVDVNFDPTKGRAVSRAEQQADLQNQIDAVKKEQQLLDAETGVILARKKKEEAESGTTSSLETTTQTNGQTTTTTSAPVTTTTTTPSTTTTTVPATTTSTTTTPAPTTTSTVGAAGKENGGNTTALRANETIKDLRTRIGQLEGRLDRVAGRFGKRTVTVPLPDAERSRAAYRAELRHRLNSVNLDDLHDHNGNSLYRLQFRATVMPGKHKDKFGIARLTFFPPKLTGKDIESLYKTWLLHLAHRLNFPQPSVRRDCPNQIGPIQRLNERGLVKILEIRFWAIFHARIRPCTFYLPLPPDAGISDEPTIQINKKVEIKKRPKEQKKPI